MGCFCSKDGSSADGSGYRRSAGDLGGQGKMHYHQPEGGTGYYQTDAPYKAMVNISVKRVLKLGESIRKAEDVWGRVFLRV